MIKRNKRGRLQFKGLYVKFIGIDFYKLFLNLLILAVLGFITWSAIKLFSGEFFNSPLIGSLVFFGEIIAFIILCRHIGNNRWRPPSILKTVITLVVISLILAFAGVQPISDYKDSVVNWFTGINITPTDYANTKTVQDDKNQTTSSSADNTDNELDNASKSVQIEHEVVNLVNNTRASRGTPTLVWDDKLYIYSKSHSKDMAEKKQLFHTAQGSSYAENCWGGEGSTHWDANTIVESWMNSDLHRTWLLCPNLKHVAVGVAISDTGMYASWTFWVNETNYYTDWWYCNGSNEPPEWWY